MSLNKEEEKELERLLLKADEEQRHKAKDIAGFYQFADGLIQEIEDNQPSPLVCPNCKQAHDQTGAKAPIKDGPYRGLQRYICRSCGHKYNEKSHSFFANTKKDKLTWKRYIVGMFLGFTLRQLASVCNFDYRTAWSWRHKLLREVNKLPGRVGKDSKVVWADETCYPAGSPGRTTKPNPRPTGSEIRELTTVYDGTNTAGSFTATGKANTRSGDCAYFLNHKLTNNTNLLTDKNGIYTKYKHDYTTLKNLTVTQVKSGFNFKDIKPLKAINTVHKNLKDFLGQFKGVGYKYLDNYLAWFGFWRSRPEARRALRRAI